MKFHMVMLIFVYRSLTRRPRINGGLLMKQLRLRKNVR